MQENTTFDVCFGDTEHAEHAGSRRIRRGVSGHQRPKVLDTAVPTFIGAPLEGVVVVVVHRVTN